MEVTYTIHHRVGMPDATHTVTTSPLVRAVLTELSVAGHPSLPAYLPKLGITIQEIHELPAVETLSL